MRAIASTAPSSMVLSVALGVVAGLLAATPVLFSLYRAARAGRPSMAAGLGSILASFFGIQLAILAVHLVRPAATLPFGAAAALSLLVAVSAMGLALWAKGPRR